MCNCRPAPAYITAYLHPLKRRAKKKMPGHVKADSDILRPSLPNAGKLAQNRFSVILHKIAKQELPDRDDSSTSTWYIKSRLV